MNISIKTILINIIISSFVAILALVGSLMLVKKFGIDGIGLGFLKDYLPEKIIMHEKEIVKDSQVIERYTPQTTEEEIIIDIVKKSQDAVVSVIATKDLPVVEQYFVNPFGDTSDPFSIQIPQYRQNGTEKKEVSAGTGFIVSANGLILTNKHVVSEDGAEFTVIMNNGEKYPAKVLAKDPSQDIAIIKIEKNNLPTLTLGNSDSIQVGQKAIAIGNSLGEFKNTVSIGVVSGLRRTIVASGGNMSETLDDLIQTDAAINPGNSGGPLLNLNGQVIGINTAIAQQAQNVGFALLINKAKKDLDQVKKIGKISQPYLGVRYVLIDEDMKEQNDLSVDYGALIIRGDTKSDIAVVPGSPADKAGIVENDIILEIDGKKINKDNTLAKVIQDHKVGDVVKLKILHRSEEKMISIALDERK